MHGVIVLLQQHCLLFGFLYRPFLTSTATCDWLIGGYQQCHCLKLRAYRMFFFFVILQNCRPWSTSIHFQHHIILGLFLYFCIFSITISLVKCAKRNSFSAPDNSNLITDTNYVLWGHGFWDMMNWGPPTPRVITSWGCSHKLGYT